VAQKNQLPHRLATQCRWATWKSFASAHSCVVLQGSAIPKATPLVVLWVDGGQLEQAQVWIMLTSWHVKNSKAL